MIVKFELNNNFMSQLAPHGLRRLADLHAHHDRDRSRRVFGRDITNLEKKAKNASIYEKLVASKP